jgi:hypothetical protein
MHVLQVSTLIAATRRGERSDMPFVNFRPNRERDGRYGVPGEASDAASGIWRLLVATAIIATVVTLLELAGTGGKRGDSLVATSPDPSSHAVGKELPK